MIATHYTLELYDSTQATRSVLERYETSFFVTEHPLYYHGSCGARVKTRALRTISSQSPPKVMDNVNLVCWKTLESPLAGYDPKQESTVALLERTLSDKEKTFLTKKLRVLLENDASDTWKRIPKEGVGEFSQALLQRTIAISLQRVKNPLTSDPETLPKAGFSVTTRLWVLPKLAPLAIKVAGLISHIDSHRTVSLMQAEHSSPNSPTIQISRSYETHQKYLDDSANEDLDPILDLLLHIIATSHSRNYWTRS